MVLSLDFSSYKLTENDWAKRNYVETWLKNHHNTYIWSGGDSDS